MALSTPFGPISDPWLGLRPSFRSLAEQAIGFALFLTFNLGGGLLNRWIALLANPGDLAYRLILAPWIPSGWFFISIWIFFYLSQSLSCWILWRRTSLTHLRVEATLFLIQFSLQILWSIFFYYWQDVSMALIILFLQLIATILCTMAFWKKDRSAGLWMLPELATGIYLIALVMAICLGNLDCTLITR